MSGYGYCYDGTVAHCYGRARSGVLIFQGTILEFIPGISSYGIYNCRPKRTSSSLSLHADGRADDLHPDSTALGTMLAFFCVAAAQMIGCQRVIWGFGTGHAAKEWDSREGERYWEDYSGPAHDDHCHIEFCLEAANNLTRDQVVAALRQYWKGPLKKPLDEEDELTDDEKRKLEFVYQAVKRDKPGGGIEGIDKWLDRELKALNAKIDKLASG